MAVTPATLAAATSAPTNLEYLMSQSDPTNPFTTARLAAGMSMKQMADAAGYDYSYIAAVEAGSKRPSKKFIDRYAQALGIPPNSLVVADDDRADFLDAALGAMFTQTFDPGSVAAAYGPVERDDQLPRHVIAFEDIDSIRNCLSAMVSCETTHGENARATAVWSDNLVREMTELYSTFYNNVANPILAVGGRLEHSVRGGADYSDTIEALKFCLDKISHYLNSRFELSISTDSPLDVPIDIVSMAHSGIILFFGRSLLGVPETAIYIPNGVEFNDTPLLGLQASASLNTFLKRYFTTGKRVVRTYGDRSVIPFLDDMFEMEQYDGESLLVQSRLADFARPNEDFADDGPVFRCLTEWQNLDKNEANFRLKILRRAARSFHRRIEKSPVRHIASTTSLRRWLAESRTTVEGRRNSEEHTLLNLADVEPAKTRALRMHYIAQLLETMPHFEMALVPPNQEKQIFSRSNERQETSWMVIGSEVLVLERTDIPSGRPRQRRQLLVEHTAAAREASSSFARLWASLPAGARDRRTVREELKQIASEVH